MRTNRFFRDFVYLLQEQVFSSRTNYVEVVIVTEYVVSLNVKITLGLKELRKVVGFTT